ncbi:MAG TPA: hypothetical protein ENG95_02480 [Nitrospirae bacterium]|nr:hypothetical protein [Nitrospirota bacterium]
MRRDEYEEISAEAANAELGDESYTLLSAAIGSSGTVNISYIPAFIEEKQIDENGKTVYIETENTASEIFEYTGLIPIGFYLSDSAHLWAYHKAHDRRESYACSRIITVTSE